MTGIERLLERVRRDGEGPTVEIRPYDSGHVRVWVWTPGITHDGYDQAAEAKGATLEEAATKALRQLEASNEQRDS